MINLPNKDKFLRNFFRCGTWEEKYLYIIELGSALPPFPKGICMSDYLIGGCQSKVWLIVMTDNDGIAQLYGDGDASIVKGLIAMTFVLYQGMTPAGIISYDVQPFFKKIALSQHLTPSRSQGLAAIVKGIRNQAAALI